MINKLEKQFHKHFQKWNKLSLKKILVWKKRRRVQHHKEMALLYLGKIDEMLWDYVVLQNALISAEHNDNHGSNAEFRAYSNSDDMDTIVLRRICRRFKKESGIGTIFEFYNRNYGSVNGNSSHFLRALINDNPIAW